MGVDDMCRISVAEEEGNGVMLLNSVGESIGIANGVFSSWADSELLLLSQEVISMNRKNKGIVGIMNLFIRFI
jgi:hypothetical protein